MILLLGAYDIELITRLQSARTRVSARIVPPAAEPLPEIEEVVIEPEIEEEPPVSFLTPPIHSPEFVTDVSEPEAMLSDSEKLDRLMHHWRTNPKER